MVGGKYGVLLVVEHGLYPPELDTSESWHDQICMSMKGSYSRLSYNTNDGDATPWNQYGGMGVTLAANVKSRMASKGAGPTKLGRWTWVWIEGKVGKSTVFVSAYRPCKRKNGMDTVWNQHARYYQEERLIEEPDVHALFIADLCRALGNLRDFGHHAVLGMDANDDVRDGAVTAALAEIGIEEAVIKNHGGESVPTTCARNTQRKSIDSIWTSLGLDVLRCGFLPFLSVYGFPSDHQMIWAKICNQSMFGHCPQQTFVSLFSS